MVNGCPLPVVQVELICRERKAMTSLYAGKGRYKINLLKRGCFRRCCWQYRVVKKMSSPRRLAQGLHDSFQIFRCLPCVVNLTRTLHSFTIIYRLRTGHCGLRAHVKRLDVVDTALMCQCGTLLEIRVIRAGGFSPTHITNPTLAWKTL
jgi:hypothetical protein